MDQGTSRRHGWQDRLSTGDVRMAEVSGMALEPYMRGMSCRRRFDASGVAAFVVASHGSTSGLYDRGRYESARAAIPGIAS